MTTGLFEATVRSSGPVTVIDLSGNIDGTTDKAMYAAWDSITAPGPVVLNFEGAGYMNSTGIAVIVGLLSRARAASRDIRAFGLTDHYKEIFALTRLADFIAIHDNENSATSATDKGGPA